MTFDIRAPLSSPLSVNHHATADLYPALKQALLTTLENSSHTFLQPPPSLHAASLVLAKRYLDPLATLTSDVQLQRQQNSRRKRKRKRGEVDDYGSQKPLRLREVHLEGFRIDQIWQQARRVLDASRLEIERSLPVILQKQNQETLSGTAAYSRGAHEEDIKSADLDEDGISADGSDVQETGMDEDESMVEAEGILEGQKGSRIDGKANFYKEDEDMLDEDLADGIEGEDLEASDLDEEPRETFIPDKLGLNDGFFSIDDFNKQSEFMEQQDALGDNDGTASDEEDVDWDADPMAITSSRKNGQALDNAAPEGSEDEDGPTFGNADLNDPDISDSNTDSDNGVEMEGIGFVKNTNDIKYADFFEPPPRKASKSHRRALPKTQPSPSSTTNQNEIEDDLQRTISAVRRDIFDDELTPDEDGAASDTNDARSSHQKRQAALTAEIRKLEAAAVAKRDWTLSGEARAADRPINSLLEEDLQFERAGKPIPVITQEVSEDIEALIKRRIIAREFDEVIRRRPGNLATGAPDVRRGRFELEDTKPQQSLAEIYEADHLKNADPENYTSKADAKLKSEHTKIEAMWKNVSAKLDALSSWHYKPKPPSASINIVADVPAISMEDARPAAGGEVRGESMLAPQEIYKAGEGRDKKAEVVTGSGLPVGREEMTRDEKVRRRRREKERIRKAGGLVPSMGAKEREKGSREVGKKAKERQGVIGDLKKGGVRIIGKKGEIKDMEGDALKSGSGAGKGAGKYKL
ncbi:hypothetical protein N7G274_004780 [Stereocaulon virgatum]|uniref:U3 small nucleolar ribonucleoprotein protein MPP10 n=1 Tax=Stereocaulon virgatum TaxID=373712 RepID=A0ABR4A8T6_9LECA